MTCVSVPTAPPMYFHVALVKRGSRFSGGMDDSSKRCAESAPAGSEADTMCADTDERRASPPKYRERSPERGESVSKGERNDGGTDRNALPAQRWLDVQKLVWINENRRCGVKTYDHRTNPCSTTTARTELRGALWSGCIAYEFPCPFTSC